MSGPVRSRLSLPPRKLYDKEAELNWVIFHDVLATSRVFVRTLCPIRYDWVKDLLPKLHQVDVYELSSVAKEEVTEDEIIKWEKREAAKRQQGVLENSLDDSFFLQMGNVNVCPARC